MKEIKIYNDDDYGLTVEHDGFFFPCQDNKDLLTKVKELIGYKDAPDNKIPGCTCAKEDRCFCYFNGAVKCLTCMKPAKLPRCIKL